MKKLIIYLSISAALIGCIGELDQPNVTTIAKPKTLLVVIIDYSLSTNNEVNYWDSITARRLYIGVSNIAPATVKVIGVYSNSLEQDILSFDVQGLDTTNIDTVGNIYLRGKAKKDNLEAKADFDVLEKEQVQQFITTTCRPHDNKYSDVSSALALAKIACEQENFENYEKKIIAVYSDFQNDLHNKGLVEIEPVQLPTNTRVLCLRPALSIEKLQKIFPTSKVEVVTTANDINSIIQKQ